MTPLTFKHATAIGSMERALEYRDRVADKSYFERVRFANKVLGGDWIFRLADVVGIDEIEAKRPTWSRFYVENEYGTNLPIDPRAPETEEYLGMKGGAQELGFYCGMGFDGYADALSTARKVDSDSVDLQYGDYHLQYLSEETLHEENVFEDDETIEPEAYYRIYGETLNQLFENFEEITERIQGYDDGEHIDEELQRRIVNTAAGSKIYLCGAHRGCGSHHSVKEATASRLDSIITFLYARSLARVEQPLSEHKRRR
ncbi:hypothetical protein C440_06782 [Haloferax mucosum ATCC BAA-1512]|uniref:Uncharacterized protein n=1 Tax=Haloferax mucosum ATCC BAA-1512 TaxID=662479 RepID=M0IGS1_9EURY|nr:hypothetical protein [Haloferax mucosum]ELZ95975.1 hypothetical protein C440_06782 [Haloferax mucosum ATCC BAA-1512]